MANIHASKKNEQKLIAFITNIKEKDKEIPKKEEIKINKDNNGKR